jgi:transposase
MHLEHKAGDAIMIDFAGEKLSYTDPSTGEIIFWQVFVSVLPFSGLIFVHAVHSQNNQVFTECINEMLFYYGGSPLTILTDHLKTAVTRASKYEPVFTEVCHQLGEHNSTIFSATTPVTLR